MGLRHFIGLGYLAEAPRFDRLARVKTGWLGALRLAQRVDARRDDPGGIPSLHAASRLSQRLDT